jgi:hypothetical protein
LGGDGGLGEGGCEVEDRKNQEEYAFSHGMQFRD